MFLAKHDIKKIKKIKAMLFIITIIKKIIYKKFLPILKSLEYFNIIKNTSNLFI